MGCVAALRGLRMGRNVQGDDAYPSAAGSTDAGASTRSSQRRPKFRRRGGGHGIVASRLPRRLVAEKGDAQQETSDVQRFSTAIHTNGIAGMMEKEHVVTSLDWQVPYMYAKH
mmetsp:Transcript_8544/g.16555  ORF Transcript_8544/g.16555 Transcript_8544/m.16555 type:complete len:113 (+) Transcript_8544:284-622(+)